MENIKVPGKKSFGKTRDSLSILKDFGYNDGICKALGTDKDTGIKGDEADLESRRETFGKNDVVMPSYLPFWRLVLN